MRRRPDRRAARRPPSAARSRRSSAAPSSCRSRTVRTCEKNSPCPIVEVHGVDGHDVAELLAQAHELDGAPSPATMHRLGCRTSRSLCPCAPCTRLPRSVPSRCTASATRCHRPTRARQTGAPLTAAVVRSTMTFDEPPGCIVTPSRQSAGLHRALLVADDEQLGLVPELGDEPEEAVKVDVVERGLDLVHHVERRGAAAEHGEQEGQRGEATAHRPTAARASSRSCPSAWPRPRCRCRAGRRVG